MTRLRRALALGAGSLLALIPVAALAQDDPSRALPVGADAMQVFAYTIAAVAAMMLVGALGWLYQQKRGLHWDFQADAHANDSHDAHH